MGRRRSADLSGRHLDGETRPVLRVNDDKLGGYFLLGNTRYPVSGQKLEAVPRARRRWSRIRTSRKPARR